MNGSRQILFGIVLICFIFGINYLIFDKKLKSLEEKNLKAINLIKEENIKAAKAYINKFKEEFTAPDVELPEQIQELFEAFERKDEKLDNKRIEKAIKGLSEKQLIEVFAGIKWESDPGQKLQKYLIDNKVFTKIDFEFFSKEIPVDIDIKKCPDMTGVYKCGGDSQFLKCFEPCISYLRCCFYRCCRWPVCALCDDCLPCLDCKKCCCFGCYGDCGSCGNYCWPCGGCFPMCSTTRKIRVGPERDTGEYVYTSKLYFEGNVEVIDEISSHARVRVVINDGSLSNVATLDGDGKLPMAQLPDAVIGCIKYQGYWDATSAFPGGIASNTNKGHYYIVNTAGTQSVNGINEWAVNDWIVSNGTAWKKNDNTDSVTSVAGKTGSVTLSKSDVGLSAVHNVEQIPMSEKGIANGVATLDSSIKLPSAQLPNEILGGVKYQGAWDATSAFPGAAASNTNKGHYYIVTTAGTQSVNGINEWAVNDWIVSNGTVWTKIDNTDSVTSVVGKIGAVTLNKSDVGLGNVTNDAQIPLAQKGESGGVATLDANQNVITVNKVVFGAGNLKTRSGGLVFGTGSSNSCRTVQISGAGGNCD